MEWQFPWPYRNYNPIAQMLEMVHYILRFIITMKHVIYGAILSAARASGEHCKLPQRGLGRSPSGNQIWCILALTFSSFPWPVGTLFLNILLIVIYLFLFNHFIGNMILQWFHVTRHLIAKTDQRESGGSADNYCNSHAWTQAGATLGNT